MSVPPGRPMSRRVRDFFEEAPEPEGSLQEVFDDAEYEAARHLDPSLHRASELRLRLIGPAAQSGWYNSEVQDALAGPLGREVAAAAGPDNEAARIGLVGVSEGSVVLHYRPQTPLIEADNDSGIEVSSADVAIRRVLELHRMFETGRPAAEIAGATKGHHDLLKNARAVVEGLDRFQLDLNATWWPPSGPMVRSLLSERGRTHAQGIFAKQDETDVFAIFGRVTALDIDGVVTVREGQTKYPVQVEAGEVRAFTLGGTVHLRIRSRSKVDRVGLRSRNVHYELIDRIDVDTLPISGPDDSAT